MHTIDQRWRGRCGNHGSPSESLDLRFTWPNSPTIHIPRTVPFLSASGNHGYFTSLFFSPSPHLCVCLVRRLSFSCIISQMRGSRSQIPMWLVLPCPELHASQHKPRLFAPSIRHVRRSSPCHCSPLFPFLTCTSE